ncbi:hypothetical protein AAF712_011264 [Marasmius tenuissimus]|uniref:Uncharacterized protein n=1 Tax=Marasmius tenuissimus TaxID=585030 RepID=A0ABR2ZKM7_9AGAR
MAPQDFLFSHTEGHSNIIIWESWVKCIASRALIAEHISRASAGYEKTRRELNAGREAEGNPVPEEEVGEVGEERLLSYLLATGEELQFALRRYEDLERVARREKAQEESEKVRFLLTVLGLLRQDEIEQEGKTEREGNLHQEGEIEEEGEIERQLYHEEMDYYSTRAGVLL